MGVDTTQGYGSGTQKPQGWNGHHGMQFGLQGREYVPAANPAKVGLDFFLPEVYTLRTPKRRQEFGAASGQFEPEGRLARELGRIKTSATRT